MIKRWWFLWGLFVFSGLSAWGNLLSNGGFEALDGSGVPADWSNATSGHVETVTVWEGDRSVRLQTSNAALLTQGWVSVMPGREYVLTGWFKGDAFSGEGWGQLNFKVTNDDWEGVASYSISELENMVGSGTWHKLAVGFTADTSGVQIGIGVFGPKEVVDVYFDAIQLLEKSDNLAPTLSPVASVTSGEAPLSVQFTANADDPDGAVQYFVWNFGDGGEGRSADPLYAYPAAGTFTPMLTVYDNDGKASSVTLSAITIIDTQSPTVEILSPASDGSYSTSSASISLRGSAAVASSGGAGLSTLAWDNLRTGRCGYIAASMDWAFSAIDLAPGINEILLTVTDVNGQVGTDRLLVDRCFGAPVIANLVRIGSGDVPLYDLYEVQFDLGTVAENRFYTFDPDAPKGADGRAGVCVEGVFTGPGGERLVQPAYYHPVVERGTDGRFRETGEAGTWRLRFTPREVGTWSGYVRAQDRNGLTSISLETFVTVDSERRGFIGVSPEDSRYFLHNNGDLFFPLGPAFIENFTQNSGVMNLNRPWMAGYGAYSSNWARWVSSAEQHGNEGFQAPLTYRHHYPGHDLSYKMVVDGVEPEGHWMWFGRLWKDSQPEIEPGRTYRLKLRCRIQGVTAEDAGQPCGLTGMVHGWTPSGTDWVDYLASIPSADRAFEPIGARRGWHTIVRDFSVSSNKEYFSLLLQNVASGEVYIDELSIREVDGGGAIVGGEQIRNSRADLFAYVDSRGAASLEYQVQEGMTHGVYYKYVVQDKNDWTPGHLTRLGFFHDSGHGYYQERGTRMHWHLRQWWRYLVARWGAFPCVQSWELVNEGAPEAESHWKATQALGAFMRETGAHPAQVSTSFWSSWVPEFWGNDVLYPDVDYADIHHYTKGDAAGRDLAGWFITLADEVYADAVGKPVMLAEHGVSVDTADGALLSGQPNPGIWYHNLLWAQLHPAGMSAFNYWFSSHFQQVDLYYYGEDRGGFSRVELAASFREFLSRLDLPQGNYADAAVTASVGLRAVGQKNPDSQKAHLWIQNVNHTWYAALTANGSISPVSGTVALTMAPSRSYLIEWWDTWAGGVTSSETIVSGSDGVLVLDVTNLDQDIAVLVQPRGGTGAGANSWDAYRN